MKSKIYTRVGDDGSTALVSGKRVFKDNLRLDVYGNVDELNSSLGLVCTLLKGKEKYNNILEYLLSIQSLLFNLGSLLACEKKDHEKFKLERISEESIIEIEKYIDNLDMNLIPLKNFILPGGSLISSYIHLSRTICRRVERKLVYFYRKTPEETLECSLKFLNRLSDLFFILARFINAQEGVSEILWFSKK